MLNQILYETQFTPTRI
jgi:hypothetical protein